MKSGKKECFAEGWKASLIDQVEENMRLADMFDRAQLVFKSGIKEHVSILHSKYLPTENVRLIENLVLDL